MRELKFRAWDNEDKSYWHNIQSYRYINAISGPGIELHFDCFNNDNYIIEQYIGQNDIDGNEIYEGDILQTDEANWIAKVVYNYDGFMLIELNDKGFSCSPSYKNCKIIGNIHEYK